MTFSNSNCILTIVVNDSCRGWKKVTKRGSSHCPTSIQGLLIKKHFPGLVLTAEGNHIVPEKWHHFSLVKDENDEVLADKIKREFWVSLCIASHISIQRIRWTFFKQ